VKFQSFGNTASMHGFRNLVPNKCQSSGGIHSPSKHLLERCTRHKCSDIDEAADGWMAFGISYCQRVNHHVTSTYKCTFISHSFSAITRTGSDNVGDEGGMPQRLVAARRRKWRQSDVVKGTGDWRVVTAGWSRDGRTGARSKDVYHRHA